MGFPKMGNMGQPKREYSFSKKKEKRKKKIEN